MYSSDIHRRLVRVVCIMFFSLLLYVIYSFKILINLRIKPRVSYLLITLYYRAISPIIFSQNKRSFLSICLFITRLTVLGMEARKAEHTPNHLSVAPAPESFGMASPASLAFL